jgi:DNA-binding MarR family transcriptional regulator
LPFRVLFLRCSPGCSGVSYVPYMIPPGLKESLLFHLEGTARIVNRRAERLLQETLGIGVREAHIIQAASSDPPLSQGCMADCLGVNRNVMVLEIDRLDVEVHEDKHGARVRGAGYVKRERREESRREATIVLTAKGKRMLAAIRKLRAQMWREVLRPTTAEQREALVSWARDLIEQDAPPPSSKAKRKKS